MAAVRYWRVRLCTLMSLLIVNLAFCPLSSNYRWMTLEGAGLHSASSSTSLWGRGKSGYRDEAQRSKRQNRMGRFIQMELGQALHRGLIKGKVTYIEDELRKRISIVEVDVSPDMKNARVVVSTREPPSGSTGTPSVDRRQAYSWLVENRNALKHTLAKKMSHMKVCPNLMFDQVNLGTAVDVMFLIDKVADGYERESLGKYGGDDDSLPDGFSLDADEAADDDDWEEEDEHFFD